jgi:anti-sigma factor RsiW
MRFGGNPPEELEIRGAPGLLWRKDGQLTVYWQEEGVGHVVRGSQPQEELFRVIEDFL